MRQSEVDQAFVCRGMGNRTNEALFALLGFGSALPQCSSLEFITITISDSAAVPFAVIGVSTGGGN